MSLHWQTALRDGALIALAASLLVMGTLRANPRLLMRHFPQELRAAVAPMTPRERVTGRLVGLLLIGLLVVGPWVSTAVAFGDVAPPGFADAFIHAFTVSMVFNTVDWLILDEFWLGVLRPAWAMLPGAEGVTFRFNHLQHARGFLVGSIVSAAVAGIVALVVSR